MEKPEEGKTNANTYVPEEIEARRKEFKQTLLLEKAGPE